MPNRALTYTHTHTQNTRFEILNFLMARMSGFISSDSQLCVVHRLLRNKRVCCCCFFVCFKIFVLFVVCAFAAVVVAAAAIFIFFRFASQTQKFRSHFYNARAAAAATTTSCTFCIPFISFIPHSFCVYTSKCGKERENVRFVCMLPITDFLYS